MESKEQKIHNVTKIMNKYLNKYQSSKRAGSSLYSNLIQLHNNSLQKLHQTTNIQKSLYPLLKTLKNKKDSVKDVMNKYERNVMEIEKEINSRANYSKVKANELNKDKELYQKYLVVLHNTNRKFKKELKELINAIELK